MGYGLEVDMIRSAHELGMLTTPYVFNEDEATQMAEAGADIVVAHMGLTTSGETDIGNAAQSEVRRGRSG
jgi:predicted TIM-barrel enzyme